MKISSEKTKEYYNGENPKVCDCVYCRNYLLQIENEYPEIVSYLMSLSIDVLKPFELSSVEIGDNKIEYIDCQYIVFGSCEDEFSISVDGIEFAKSKYHPSTMIDDEHFVLGFGPIVLEMKIKDSE